jgi:hypothetical protein
VATTDGLTPFGLETAGMKPAACHLLNELDILEPCPGDQCPFWDEKCLLTDLRPQLASNPPLVQFLLGLRERLEEGPRPYAVREPGLD